MTPISVDLILEQLIALYIFELIYVKKFYELCLQSAGSTASLEDTPIYPLKWF